MPVADSSATPWSPATSTPARSNSGTRAIAPRELVRRGVEHGLLRRHRRPRADLSQPAEDRAAHHSGQPREALPLHGWQRQLQGVFSLGPAQLVRHQLVQRQHPGPSLPISSFFIATPSMSPAQINLALARAESHSDARHLLNQPLHVTYPNTVVLGLGYATLVPQTGQRPSPSPM